MKIELFKLLHYEQLVVFVVFLIFIFYFICYVLKTHTHYDKNNNSVLFHNHSFF